MNHLKKIEDRVISILKTNVDARSDEMCIRDRYGYTGPISTSWRSQNASDAETLAQAMATQVLIWETVVGERDEDYNHISRCV